MSGRQRLIPIGLLAVLPWTWFLARDHIALLDLAAVGLPAIAAAGVVALLTVAFLLPRTAFVLAAASWLVFGTVTTLGPWVPQDNGTPEAPLRVAVANVAGAYIGAGPTADDLVAQRADLVVVAENSFVIDGRLRGAYEYGVWDGNGVGVYADVPLSASPLDLGLQPPGRALRIELEIDGQPVALFAVHLPRPGLRGAGTFQVPADEHRQIVERLVAAAGRETRAVVIAGDLNLTDRGWGYRQLTERLDDAMRSSWAGPTSRRWPLRPLLVRIDHVLMPATWCADRAQRFGISGSDHRGIAVSIGPCG